VGGILRVSKCIRRSLLIRLGRWMVYLRPRNTGKRLRSVWIGVHGACGWCALMEPLGWSPLSGTPVHPLRRRSPHRIQARGHL
jgi:hypothetical protein